MAAWLQILLSNATYLCRYARAQELGSLNIGSRPAKRKANPTVGLCRLNQVDP
jgi:phosphoenolpyruvate carboxylase